MEAQFATLIRDLDAAVQLADTATVTEAVKTSLERFSRGEAPLPSRFRQSCRDTYARRLLHRSSELEYTVVVMTWGPGQGTALHDHAGIWCVECVVDGELHVQQFDLVDHIDDRYRFEQRKQVRAGVGSAGCLIPPYEYHTLANALDDHTSITIHVYGGEMDYCHLYQPEEDAGWWKREARQLEYAS